MGRNVTAMNELVQNKPAVQVQEKEGVHAINERDEE
jgi:hypothetical protein